MSTKCMPPARFGHRHVSRLILWTAGAVLFFVGYLASAPFLQFAIERSPPSLAPRLNTFGTALYFPVAQYLMAGWPGSDLYLGYFEWCLGLLKRHA